jgi:hypothetical protein
MKSKNAVAQTTALQRIAVRALWRFPSTTEAALNPVQSTKRLIAKK